MQTDTCMFDFKPIKAKRKTDDVLIDTFIPSFQLCLTIGTWQIL